MTRRFPCVSFPPEKFFSVIRVRVQPISYSKHASTRITTCCQPGIKGPVGSRLISSDGIKAHQRTQGDKNKSWRNGVVLLGIIPAWLALNLVLEISRLDEALTNLRVGRPLNQTSFVPFSIVSKEQVSPTSFILAVRPKFARDPREQQDIVSRLLSLLFPRARFPRESHTSRPILETAWEHGLWSVEIKQPQLQVARDYTPLPAPSPEDERTDRERGELRFLIRKMDGGEVSTYLSRLRVGDTVELRGPHLGFDVKARLGSADRVVFLAGGTGIAPALQTVRAVSAGGKGSLVSVIWANRHRADCPGIGGPSSQSTTEGITSPNSIVSLLAQMKQRYRDRLQYACTVDEEGTAITSADILQAMGFHTRCKGVGTHRSWFTSTEAASDGGCPDPEPINTEACKHHSPTALQTSAEKDPFTSTAIPAGSTAVTDPNATCHCVDAQGAAIAGGKNLLMVSGPEGFITTFAGAKTWGNGTELQGPLGGVCGRLKQMLPRFWADWLVLKL